ncbi:MAG: DUF3037 domain-containing protein [Bryobacteraceae bacterium]
MPASPMSIAPRAIRIFCDAALRARLTNASFVEILEQVPDAWLVPEAGISTNARAIVFRLERNFIHARLYLDEARLRALWPGLDLDLVRQRLGAIEKICSGGVDDASIAKLSRVGSARARSMIAGC